MNPLRTLRCFMPVAFLSLIGAIPSQAQEKAKPKEPAGPAPSKTVTYKESGGKPRVIDLYFPPMHDPAKSKVPGLILFHGGGWGGGNRSQFSDTCAYFASRGLVCATVEYQLMSRQKTEKAEEGSGKRVCIVDAKSAIRWFKQHAAELGIDPQKIITGGGSAGGHISALATLNPGLNDPADPKDIDTSVVAYLWFNPAFSTGDKSDSEIDILKHQKKDLPPAIVFFGDADNWKTGWDTAHEMWKTLGTRSIDLRIASKQAHGFFNKEPWKTVALIEADKFLVQQGLLAGEPTLKPPSTGEKFIPQASDKTPKQN